MSASAYPTEVITIVDGPDRVVSISFGSDSLAIEERFPDDDNIGQIILLWDEEIAKIYATWLSVRFHMPNAFDKQAV